MMVLNLLTGRNAPIKVEKRHIEYVDGLYTRLLEAREAVASKREYVQTANRVGGSILKTEAVKRAQSSLEAGSTQLNSAEKSFDRIKLALSMGYEPTTPPANWYCGHVTEPKKVKTRDSWGRHEDYPRETWPKAYTGSAACMVYMNAIPVHALEKYNDALSLFGSEIRIYSPEQDDFSLRHNPVRRVIDPVLIGAIEFLGERQYFEIARWDIDKDLEKVLGKV